MYVSFRQFGATTPRLITATPACSAQYATHGRWLSHLAGPTCHGVWCRRILPQSLDLVPHHCIMLGQALALQTHLRVPQLPQVEGVVELQTIATSKKCSWRESTINTTGKACQCQPIKYAGQANAVAVPAHPLRLYRLCCRLTIRRKAFIKTLGAAQTGPAGTAVLAAAAQATNGTY